MQKKYYQIIDGKISVSISENVEYQDKMYLSKVPTNFLELLDELKKLSFVCHLVQVTIINDKMEICLYTRDSLDIFTKHHPYLKREISSIPINMRLVEYLLTISN